MARYTVDQYKKRLDKYISEEKIRKNFYKAAFDTKNEMQERIFERGENVDGFIFDYKEGKHKEEREKKKRQTQFVDFKFTNDLYKDFIATYTTRKNLISFFVRRRNNKEKVIGLNDMFGTVFETNEEERIYFFTRFRKLNKFGQL